MLDKMHNTVIFNTLYIVHTILELELQPTEIAASLRCHLYASYRL